MMILVFLSGIMVVAVGLFVLGMSEELFGD